MDKARNEKKYQKKLDDKNKAGEVGDQEANQELANQEARKPPTGVKVRHNMVKTVILANLLFL